MTNPILVSFHLTSRDYLKTLFYIITTLLIFIPQFTTHYWVVLSQAQVIPTSPLVEGVENVNEPNVRISTNQQEQQQFNNINNNKPHLVLNDDATLIDVFGERARHILIHHLIPDTDAQCSWNWNYFRCEPYCSCSFKPLLGDYHLGRSCRLLTNQEQTMRRSSSISNSNDDNDEDSLVCNQPPKTIYVHFVRMVSAGIDILNLNIKQGLDHFSALRNKSILRVKSDLCNHLPHQSVTTTSDEDEIETTTSSSSPFHGQTILEMPVRKLRKAIKCDIDSMSSKEWENSNSSSSNSVMNDSNTFDGKNTKNRLAALSATIKERLEMNNNKFLQGADGLLQTHKNDW